MLVSLLVFAALDLLIVAFLVGKRTRYAAPVSKPYKLARIAPVKPICVFV